jgi:hypothetical protein
VTASRGSRAAAAAILVGALAALADCSGDGEPTPAIADASPDVLVVEAGSDTSDEASSDVDAAPACPPLPDGGRQTDLRCTGMYSDFASKTIAPDVLAYEPAFPFWSDGAKKSRWIRLPPGTQIDTTDMNEWRFPIGTTFFKEFVLAGKRIETRLMKKEPDGKWLGQTFRWSNDETSATYLATGEKNVNGTTYEIPVENACPVCHNGRIDNALGFEAISLGNPGGSGLRLADLVSRGLLTAPPTTSAIVPGNATESAALGWLHANCGMACHNASPNSRANFTYFYMRLDMGKLTDVASTDTFKTGVKNPSAYQPFDGHVLHRIAPGDPTHSVASIRAHSRELSIQMPPIVTHQVDTVGVTALDAWITSLPP